MNPGKHVYTKKIRTSIPAIIQFIDCSLRFGFPFVARIHIANQMITNVVTYLSRREVSGRFGKRMIGYARVAQEGVQTL